MSLMYALTPQLFHSELVTYLPHKDFALRLLLRVVSRWEDIDLTIWDDRIPTPRVLHHLIQTTSSLTSAYSVLPLLTDVASPIVRSFTYVLVLDIPKTT